MAAASLPFFHVTGAIHHYVLAAGDSDGHPEYLGTCESSPQVSFQETYKDVHNDITGPSLPAQRVENGEMASLAIGLNRFSKATWLGLNEAVSPGLRGRFSRGQMIFGRLTVQLWMVFENYLDPTTRAMYPGMEVGWYWPQVQITGKEFPRLGNGTDTLMVLHGEAHPYFRGQADPTAVGSQERTFMLYSSNISYFPPAVLVPQ